MGLRELVACIQRQKSRNLSGEQIFARKNFPDEKKVRKFKILEKKVRKFKFRDKRFVNNIP